MHLDVSRIKKKYSKIKMTTTRDVYLNHIDLGIGQIFMRILFNICK